MKNLRKGIHDTYCMLLLRC